VKSDDAVTTSCLVGLEWTCCSLPGAAGVATCFCSFLFDLKQLDERQLLVHNAALHTVLLSRVDVLFQL